MRMNLSFSSGGTEVRVRKGSVSYGLGGRLVPPSLPCRGQGIGSSEVPSTAAGISDPRARNLVVHRHGTALRQSVQEVPLSAFFFSFFSLCLLFSHFVLNTGSDYILVTG